MSSKVAVVTGGASGIGLGVARRFAKDGYAVAIMDLKAAKVAADELAEAGLAVRGYEVDVADRAAVFAAFEQVRADLGPVNVLVTSAGIEVMEPHTEVTQASWERVIDINLNGTWWCVQAALPDMIAAEAGRIITIASSSAVSGAPNMAAYTASKGGVISLTRTLARDLGPQQITANSIAPCIVDTPMAQASINSGEFNFNDVVPFVPLRRAGTPEDIAGACAYLASEDGAYVTGQVLSPNGGMQIPV